jgi:hypothetical protein
MALEMHQGRVLAPPSQCPTESRFELACGNQMSPMNHQTGKNSQMSWNLSKKRQPPEDWETPRSTFTDNTTVEAALYKGTSKSRKLLDLVVQVKLLEMRRGIRILVSHVSGLRMIAEGGDGVSRGSLNEGVMTGKNVLTFIPPPPLRFREIALAGGLDPIMDCWTYDGAPHPNRLVSEGS